MTGVDKPTSREMSFALSRASIAIVSRMITEIVSEKAEPDVADTRRKLLNIGCGRRFHPDWVNLDLTPAAATILRYDVRKPLPFADNHFDAVYHSHVLEHLPRQKGIAFLEECVRVLRPGGVLRVVVPDLEGIARAYLQTLDNGGGADTGPYSRHAWMTLEMFDQMTRTVSGGQMLAWLRSADRDALAFAKKRIGEECLQATEPPPQGLWTRLQRTSPGHVFRILRERLAKLAVYLVAGPTMAGHFQEAAFRAQGEIHQWMYDRLSLTERLRSVGLTQLAVRSFSESSIPEFAAYQLDGSRGTPHKPDSLYFEGIK